MIIYHRRLPHLPRPLTERRGNIYIGGNTMKRLGLLTLPRALLGVLALTIMVAASTGTGARADNSSGASSYNMQLVGTNDLQARSTYQPTLHKYPGGRYILSLAITRSRSRARDDCPTRNLCRRLIP